MACKKNVTNKVKDEAKNIVEKWWNIAKWKLKYVNQKWFFWLDEREQSFIETTYIVVLQMCPKLDWEDFLERLRKAHEGNLWVKSIIKSLPKR